MYPLFHIGPYIEVHFFGLMLVLAWMVLFWLLHKYTTEHGIGKNIFQNIALYTVSIFFWSRIFYILTDWRNEKYLFVDLVDGGSIIQFLKGFFITEDYHLSLAGGIFGFFLIFLWYVLRVKGVGKFEKNIDVIARSFFWAAAIGYLGALLGGQIYGVHFDSWFSLLYTNKNSIVPVGSARFPLPILYMIVWLGGGWLIEKIRKTFPLPSGFLGYIGFGIFGIFVFLFEFLNGSADMFASYPPYININQIFALIFIGMSLLGILRNIKW